MHVSVYAHMGVRRQFVGPRAQSQVTRFSCLCLLAPLAGPSASLGILSLSWGECI